MSKAKRKPKLASRPKEVIFINNHTVVVDREVFEEIAKLRYAIRMARFYLQPQID